MKTILALLILLTCCGSVFGQEKRDELDANFILLKPSCVDNSASLFSMDGTYEANDLIIIISHLGKTEKRLWRIVGFTMPGLS